MINITLSPIQGAVVCLCSLGLDPVLHFLPRPVHRVCWSIRASVLWDYNIWHYAGPGMMNGIPQRCKHRNATLLISRWTRRYRAVQFLSMWIEVLTVKAHLLSLISTRWFLSAPEVIVIYFIGNLVQGLLRSGYVPDMRIVVWHLKTLLGT